MDNKTLVDTLSKKLDVSQDTVGRLIEGLANCLGECSTSLSIVSIAGFGSFEARKRLERVAVHPASGKRLLIPPKVVLNFKSSPALKRRIKDGE